MVGLLKEGGSGASEILSALKKELSQSSRAVPWNGSGDISGMAGANCFIIVPVGTMYREGDRVNVLLLI